MYQEEEKFRENRNYERQYTGAHWLLWAMLDNNDTNRVIVDHGTNCEYPIVHKDSEFWEWIKEIKDSEFLEDN